MTPGFVEPSPPGEGNIMSVVAYCRGPACTAAPEDSLRTAAQRMEKEGIGLLVVTEEDRLVGVLTDRDIALHTLAEERPAATTRVGDAMSSSPVSVKTTASLKEALMRMSGGRVRRLPIVDEQERVKGIVSADDLVLLLARELGGLGEVLVAQLPAGASRAAGREAPEGAPRRVVEHYAREIVSASGEAPVAEVAREMESQAVGSVVVVGEDGRALGLVTDRDLALRVVAAGLDPAKTPVSAVMSTPILSVRPSEPLEEVVARMRASSVRRIPVLQDERPVGIVSFDDLLVAFGRELDQLADCVAGEIRTARARSYLAGVRRELEERIDEAATRLWDAGDHTLRALSREFEQAVSRVVALVRGGGTAALRVTDLMQRDVRTCAPEDSLRKVARIMRERDCGCVPVVAGDGSGRVVGMITDRDVCMASYTHEARLSDMQVASVMSTPVHSCRPDQTVREAESIMRSILVRRLPVVDAGGQLRGVLSLADIARGGAGLRPSARSVSDTEVAAVLEDICRPRGEPARR